MDINYINELLKQGKTVKEIRETLGISEKKFLREMKELGYKYNQKERAYIKAQEPIREVLNDNSIKCINATTTTSTKETTTPTTLSPTQTTTIDYLSENIEVLKQLLESYKRNTEANNNKDIIIRLDNDKHLNPNPKSVRINEFVWRDWLEFTKDLTYSKGDLISMALKEYMEKYK